MKSNDCNSETIGNISKLQPVVNGEKSYQLDQWEQTSTPTSQSPSPNPNQSGTDSTADSDMEIISNDIKQRRKHAAGRSKGKLRCQGDCEEAKRRGVSGWESSLRQRPTPRIIFQAGISFRHKKKKEDNNMKPKKDMNSSLICSRQTYEDNYPDRFCIGKFVSKGVGMCLLDQPGFTFLLVE